VGGSEEDAIAAAVREALVVFRDTWLASSWPLPDYRIQRDRADIVVEVGGEQIRGRLSSWLYLAGEFWAVAAQRRLGHRHRRLIPNLTWPGMGRWSTHDLRAAEDRLRPAVEHAIEDLLAGGQHLEPALCLLRFVRADRERAGLVAAPRHAEVRRLLESIDGSLQRLPNSTGYKARFGAFARWVLDPSPLERLEALRDLDWWLMYHSDEARSIRIAELVGDALLECLDHPEPVVREAGAAATSRLAAHLWWARAHAQALPFLRRVVAEGEGLAVNCLRLWETCLALEQPDEAAATWALLEPLGDVGQDFQIGVNFFDAGSLRDARAACLARVAQDLLDRALGRSPCKEVRARARVTPEQGAAFRQRAELLVDEAIELLEPELEAWLRAARSKEIISRHFSAAPFALKARFEEGRGNRGEALRRFKQAQSIAHGLSMSWRRDDFDEDVARLSRRA
jgi:hypothetical protein